MEDNPDVEPTNRVLRARLAAGLTQQVLATRAGLATRTLARIEDGEDTKVSTLAAIAEVLGVELGDLIETPAA
jgi:transcriptional regulator with XRE-family HTH domain